MAENEELEEKTPPAEAEKDDKKDKKDKKGDQGIEGEEEQEETLGSKLVLFFVTLLIILIWLGIIGIIIKSDAFGFGSSVLYPVLKDVPYVNKILPKNEELSTEDDAYAYNTIGDAIKRIKELELELDAAQASDSTSSQTIEELNAEIAELMKYKEEQANFEKEKEKFYEEVVFSDNAPDINEYKTYYESIDPENAEVLYKQVVQQAQKDSEIKDYATTYSAMKPKEAAAIFDQMTDNLELVADILMAMDTKSRANILGKMSAENAAKVTKIMNPES